MSIKEAIRYANSVLPGTPTPEGETDPRWQAIIDVAEFIPTHPESVWSFIVRWGIHPDEDVRTAVATCLLEHLLEDHFAVFFPRVEHLAARSDAFADTFMRCGKFGQCEEPDNKRKFDALRECLSRKGVRRPRRQ